MSYFSLITLFLFASNALAGCRLKLRTENISFTWPGATQVLSVQGSVRRNKTDSDCKKVEIGFSMGKSNNYHRELRFRGSAVSYNLYKTQNSNTPLKSIDDARNQQEKISVKFDNKKRKANFSFIAKLPYPNNGKTFFPSGNFKDRITVRAQLENDEDTNDKDRIKINLFIPPQVDISLVGPGGPFNINDTTEVLNFGILEKGKSLAFDIVVRANIGHSLKLSSVNNGKLKHVSENYYTKYKMHLNGNKISLKNSANSPVTVGGSNNPTPENGLSHEARVTIKGVKKKLQGTYSDFIVISAIANE